HFGRHCHTEAELDDGRSRVRIAAPTPRDIARNLAGWGSLVEVLAPPRLPTPCRRTWSWYPPRRCPPWCTRPVTPLPICTSSAASRCPAIRSPTI
ncbi:WYL domain-containing protein, partial [Nocardia carnea]|uniref:WYL domain-containing protein n=1 Tax=Nocardia carnea TaxID=37328 RepID=UPI0032AFFADC